jgi:hypothetical protein
MRFSALQALQGRLWLSRLWPSNHVARASSRSTDFQKSAKGFGFGFVPILFFFFFIPKSYRWQICKSAPTHCILSNLTGRPLMIPSAAVKACSSTQPPGGALARSKVFVSWKNQSAEKPLAREWTFIKVLRPARTSLLRFPKFPSRAAAEPGRATIGRSSGIRGFDSILDSASPGPSRTGACRALCMCPTGQVTPMREPLAPIPVISIQRTAGGFQLNCWCLSRPVKRAEPNQPDQTGMMHPMKSVEPGARWSDRLVFVVLTGSPLLSSPGHSLKTPLSRCWDPRERRLRR